MRATFEEKTYENYFNIELGRQTDILFPLGQVQEGSLGFDCSAMSRNRGLWRTLGLFQPFLGINLRKIADKMEHYLRNTLVVIPKIKANLLFQYKKPEYITRRSGSEWSYWNKPYYRYDIYGQQQDLLMHIDNHFGNRVFIVYASPALHDINDLVTAYTNGQIINISNFRKVSELDGHHRNTYTQSGRHSIACSGPEKFDNFDLLKEINELTCDRNTDEDNRSFVINFSKQLSNVIYEDKYYSESYRKLNEQFSEFKQYELLYSHLTLHNFNQLTGTQWLMKL
jgi:hypothetical protein